MDPIDIELIVKSHEHVFRVHSAQITRLVDTNGTHEATDRLGLSGAQQLLHVLGCDLQHKPHAVRHMEQKVHVDVHSHIVPCRTTPHRKIVGDVCVVCASVSPTDSAPLFKKNNKTKLANAAY